jgi:hypothetical protein
MLSLDGKLVTNAPSGLKQRFQFAKRFHVRRARLGCPDLATSNRV